jgi:single-stranded-DNA-specific exonuclease
MRWNIKQEITADKNTVLDILLSNRNIEKSFIKKYTVDDLPDPMSIYDMDKCVERIERAIENKEKIYIHGDFDVDGTAATAILWNYLYRTRKADVLPYIPHRVDEGYGMSKKTIDKLIEDGAKLVISVDCGVKDIELVEYGKTKGIDIMISDHHEFVRDEAGNPVLADTIVIHGMHPKSKNPIVICGGVTAWLIACALEKSLTGNAYTETTLSFLDLAMITTLSDIMPLKAENRVIVAMGLELMKGTSQLRITNYELRIGLRELCKIAGVEPKDLETYHIGFVLGPRLNAPGRVENSAINSLRILCTEDFAKAKELAQHLDQLNKKRQDMTEKYMNEVKTQIEFDNEKKVKTKVIVAYGENWPEGIVGLVAGKIAEKYYRPTFIMSHNLEENKVTGSARSIKNFHLVKALDECKDHLVRYGGHYMAAGYSLEPSKIEDFKKALITVGDKIITDEDIIPQLNIDCYYGGDFTDLDMITQIGELAPFGYGNTTPVFASKNAKLVNIRLLGNQQQHIKFSFFIDDQLVDGIAFNCSDDWKKLGLNKFYDIAYCLDVNEWNGRKTIQLQMKDVRDANYTNF